ncbi:MULTISPECIES: N-formylglutamate deformylase [unclassified Paracoccus (in: a-proteobacteria)]|uniref:N-formylglutamate deformylase n=1 Tax=unclassified Paracoccus (in: a-proteobacteria) TaxID=2688777 RepID=UPI0013535D42|nr:MULTISPECIES: N-formylglutamate deformylase [unclassified Paracoccus (in: a-proteobacteria)]UXU75380.1 N-formylglutamate deformylase [Paracoccus sp. SMMA_5]UXU81284.1 N-formylglutamate deformylase [Paracoccus sp. SMMA_5_TC]
MTPVEVSRGDGPVILGLPHTGTWLPDDIRARLNDRGQILADTDWHIERLYDGLLPGATTVRATFHRYVIDANRGPDDASLYPGQNTTGLVPLTDFDGQPIWTQPPTADDIAARKARFHAPYHAALAAEIARVKARHGVAILYDCHSIRSHIPFLFEGTLPDFNIGTNSGQSCDPRIEAAALQLCAATGRSHVLNGRFKGGWTTRHYGQPAQGVHAIQMELAQSTHLASEAPPFAYDPARAEPLRDALRAILERLAALAPEVRP